MASLNGPYTVSSVTINNGVHVFLRDKNNAEVIDFDNGKPQVMDFATTQAAQTIADGLTADDTTYRSLVERHFGNLFSSVGAIVKAQSAITLVNQLIVSGADVQKVQQIVALLNTI